MTRDKYLVAVGTSNKAKIRGIKRAFSLLGAAEYIIVPTHGFVDQPIGLKEILLGAIKRAIEAYEEADRRIGNVDFGVGLEAGIIEVGDIALSGEIAVVVNSGRYSIGFSGFFPLPRRVYGDISGGKELKEVMIKLSGIENIGEGIGAIGFLTYGYETRVDLSYQAVLHALLPWLNHNIEYGLPEYNVLKEILKSGNK
ncbi:MAG: inosine/xanthosine triphosphatase [Thermoprotei archaeon]